MKKGKVKLKSDRQEYLEQRFGNAYQTNTYMILTKLARAQGLAESLTMDIKNPREGATKEIATEIFEILESTRQQIKATLE